MEFGKLALAFGVALFSGEFQPFEREFGGLFDAQALQEALADGALGNRVARVGEFDPVGQRGFVVGSGEGRIG